MKIKYSFLIIVIILFYTENLSAQQLFKDSGQSLGNNYSTSVKLGDLDCDGDLDAVVANPSHVNSFTPTYQTNEIWLNDGKGNFSKKTQQLSGSEDITLVDIDQDGDLDLVEYYLAGWNENPIQTWLNDGKANFTKTGRYGFEGDGIAFDKFSGKDKGYKAITVESSNVSTILRIYSFDNSSCELENRLDYQNCVALRIAPGDLNNDGYPDLVMNRYESDYILLNDKQGGFLKSSQELTGTNHPLMVELKDLNGDGFLDIIQGNRRGKNWEGGDGSLVYLNDGSGRFTTSSLPFTYNYDYYAAVVTAADMDNDGDQDIFMHQHNDDSDRHVSIGEILLNDGLANFSATTVPMNTLIMSVAFGDLDNDGDPDMFLAGGSVIWNPYRNQVWLNTTIDSDN